MAPIALQVPQDPSIKSCKISSVLMLYITSGKKTTVNSTSWIFFDERNVPRTALTAARGSAAAKRRVATRARVAGNQRVTTRVCDAISQRAEIRCEMKSQ